MGFEPTTLRYEVPRLGSWANKAQREFERLKTAFIVHVIIEIFTFTKCHSEAGEITFSIVVRCGFIDCHILLQVYHKLGLEDEWEIDDDDDDDDKIDENSSSPNDLAPSLCHPLCQCDKCRKYQQV